MPEPATILSHLEALFQEVVRAVTTGDPDQWGLPGRNAKGDQVKWFDLAADRAVCAYLEQHFSYPVRLLSEEGVPRQFGAGEPEFTMVLDPVDGSDNFARGLVHADMAVALIPAHMPLSVETVQFALVGDLFTGSIWTAARGEGALRDGQPIQPPPISPLEEIILSCAMSGFVLPPPLTQVLSRARGVRAWGAAALALAMVAGGTFGAHLDLSGFLTPENFLASALIITEAGGLITDHEGNLLSDIHSLTDGYTILAAATPELHTTLVQQLKIA